MSELDKLLDIIDRRRKYLREERDKYITADGRNHTTELTYMLRSGMISELTRMESLITQIKNNPGE